MDAARARPFRKSLIGLALLVVVCVPLLYPAVVIPLSPWQQAEVSLALIGVALLASFEVALRPLIMFLSCFASMRYFYWRVSFTLNLTRPRDAIVSVLLLAAEAYGLVVLLLGYFQTVEVATRAQPPEATSRTVDVYIPTYNESLDILRRTVIGALAIDYPGKRVYLLDDGRRPEVAALASNLGCLYIARADNRHAKAGNLNHALGKTEGELVAIFDADHVPVRGFLKKTVSFFEDEKVALVQSAQHFFNPDPYERNLRLTGRIAPEQSFFYHVIQPGNDFWDSAFFCGSCAVLRRSAIESIGGFKTATVTEDAHTALELHARGFASVYLPLPLAAGLATETFAAHVKQRIRWARGMAQILRLDCPLLKRGLSLPQRLNYFNAMLHFFFGLPRLILVLAPLSFLLFGIHPVQADALSLLAYILPHVALSTLANSLLSDRYRHSFWGGVYEVSIAPFTAVVTLVALLLPRKGRFDVTDKGANLDRARWDLANSWGILLLLALTLLSLMVAFPLRLLAYSRGGIEPSELDSILINSLWAFANVWTLVAACYVAYEQPQQRGSPRTRRDFACRVRDQKAFWDARTADVSEAGVRVRLERPGVVPEVGEILMSNPAGFAVRAAVERVWYEWGPDGNAEAAFRFSRLDDPTRENLVHLIFSDDASYPRDDPFRSFIYLLTTFWRATEVRRPRRRQAPRRRGRWSCVVSGGGVVGRCLSLSTTGALVEFPPGMEPSGSLEFSIEVAPGSWVPLHARVVGRRAPATWGLTFEGGDGGERIAEALYTPAFQELAPTLRSRLKALWT
jgi:cellulose synthase (UDP-forming)